FSLLCVVLPRSPLCSSSGVNTSSGSFPKSHSSHYSELSDTNTPLSVEHSPDSGIVATPYSVGHPLVLHQWAQDAAHRTLPTGRCPTGCCPTGRCPQDAIHKVLPTGMLPLGRCPQERCPQNAAHRTLPNGTLPDGTLHTGSCPQERCLQDVAFSERCLQDIAQWNAPHRVLPTGTLLAGRCPQERCPQERCLQDAAHRNTAFRVLPTGTLLAGRCPQERCLQDVAQWNAPHRVLPTGTLLAGRCPQERCPQERCLQDVAQRNTTHRNASNRTLLCWIVLLPSSRFRFVSWHRLEEHDVRGDQLACPRVREGPSEDEHSLRDEDILLRNGRRRRGDEGQRWEERLQENWENCVQSAAMGSSVPLPSTLAASVTDTHDAGEALSRYQNVLQVLPGLEDQEDTCQTVQLRGGALVPWSWSTASVRELNLSYQDLGDPYQLENFTRILRRLIRVERLQLVDNALQDLSSVRLPRCKSLNLHRNHLTSFGQLPKVPEIQHLCLSENSISSLGELSLLQATPIQSLTLKLNPCEFLEDYRSRVFSCLPKLKVLDGIPKLPDDSVPPKLPASSRLCIIL
ncbi:hypothetical protein NFI96_019877, partial [Prochilodus magdalenae]